MKSIFSISSLLLFTLASIAQSDKYTAAMKENIARIDSVFILKNTAELANRFERIAVAEKDQWLPYYYAAYLQAMDAVMTTETARKDALADKAESLLNAAETAAGKENSEIYVIKSLIATARMTADPQNRYMEYGPQIEQANQKAKELDATNPRPFLLEAQNLYYTPEAFGGGKKAARPLFEKAAELYESFQPQTELSPNWGKASLDYFMSQYEQE